MSLSEKEIDQYHEDGYVIPRYRLPSETLDAIRADHDRLLARFPEYRDYCPMLLAHDLSFLNYARDPNILDLVEQVIGPDIILWNSSFFAKPAGNGKKTPWHQDGEYWPIKPLESVTVWLSIDEVTEENGPLQYIPGSHLDRKLAEHNTLESTNVTLNQTLKNVDEIKEQAKSVHLNPGMFSLHDVYLFHGSRANNSGKRRAGLTYRYMPATSFFDHVGAKSIEDKVGYSLQRELHLISGENKGGSKIFKNHTT